MERLREDDPLFIKMRILQINTVYAKSSTGRTTKELHQALKANGIESFVIFGNGKRIKDDSNVYRSQTKVGYLFNNFFSRLFGLEGFLAYFSTARIKQLIRKIKPDIIHLRNLHGHYINIPSLFSFLNKEKMKVIISLHDLWMFTGSCPSPYLFNCEKWQTNCEKCPAKHDYPKSWFFNPSSYMHKQKKKALSQIKDKLLVLGVSSWTKEMALKANLDLTCSYIYNWVDTNIFCPQKRKQNDNFIELLCVSSIWSKGSEKLNDLIYIANNIPNSYHIKMVGYCSFEDKAFLPKNITCLPQLTPQELSAIYSESDLYLHLSHSDTFGKVIAESLACGTPVIAFNITAPSEMIEQGCGALVRPFDLDEYIEKIKSFGKKTDSVIEQCRNSSIKRFSFENIQKTIELYKDLINEN